MTDSGGSERRSPEGISLEGGRHFGVHRVVDESQRMPSEGTLVGVQFSIAERGRYGADGEELPVQDVVAVADVMVSVEPAVLLDQIRRSDSYGDDGALQLVFTLVVPNDQLDYMHDVMPRVHGDRLVLQRQLEEGSDVSGG